MSKGTTSTLLVIAGVILLSLSVPWLVSMLQGFGSAAGGIPPAYPLEPIVPLLYKITAIASAVIYLLLIAVMIGTYVTIIVIYGSRLFSVYRMGEPLQIPRDERPKSSQ